MEPKDTLSSHDHSIDFFHNTKSTEQCQYTRGVGLLIMHSSTHKHIFYLDSIQLYILLLDTVTGYKPVALQVGTGKTLF